MFTTSVLTSFKLLNAGYFIIIYTFHGVLPRHRFLWLRHYYYYLVRTVAGVKAGTIPVIIWRLLRKIKKIPDKTPRIILEF
jgi:hypothetical protein